MRRTFFAFLLLLAAGAFAQTPAVNPELLRTYWQAQWVSHPAVSQYTYGVFHFRKSIDLAQKPGSYVIHVSADNRYRLFVNGQAVCSGPARSDLLNWNYETVDLAPYLKAGRNVLAAAVWNAAESRPFAQITYQTGFLMQGDTEREKVVNTNDSWKVWHNTAYQPLVLDKAKLKSYSVTGDGDYVNGSQYPWGWETPGFDDSAWQKPRAAWFIAKPRGMGTDGNWALVPRQIPLMEEKPERLKKIRRGLALAKDTIFVTGKQPITIAANTQATLLFDQTYLTNAYPELMVSGGKDAVMTLTYAEAMVDGKQQKGNRNDVEGRQIVGLQDRFVADGGAKRLFRPLWFRTYRYLQLEVETKGAPLVINDLYGMFTGYPFEEKGYFKSGNPLHARIWEVGWRTARLCAAETYFDCPYYEQLQYVGDTRVQAMISLFASGDDRLMRKAITDFDHSRIPDGLTQSRYPCYDTQVIPTFSLFWTCMVHDYWMHRQDDAFVRERLKGVADVLEWHRQRLDADAMLGRVEWWNFVDWSWPWIDAERIGGVPDGSFTGGSSILSLQYVYALQRAAQLFAAFGRAEEAKNYVETAQKLAAGTYRRCWDDARGLLADTPAKNAFSQHANIMAVLTDALPAGRQAALLQKITTEKNIRPCTYYYQYYLFEALEKTGLGDKYLSMLQPWQDQLAIGLTTFAENPEPTRSDCHAWSASPVYHFLSLVCGIRPDAPGFAKVKIEPNLGGLPQVEGQVPHPLGNITVKFVSTKKGLKGEITLPANLSGRLIWRGREMPLKAGKQKVEI